MTFLMRILVDNADKENADSNDPGVDMLIKYIIERKYFTDEHIDSVAKLPLGTQFETQHYQGEVSENKVSNTVIVEGQIIPMKRVMKRNPDSGQYEPMECSKKGQEKMISKPRLKVREGKDGKEKETRIMLTVKKEHSEEEESVEEEYDSADSFEAVSLDEDNVESSNITPSLDLPDIEDKIGPWKLDEKALNYGTSSNEVDFSENSIESLSEDMNINKIRDKIVEPEHFDKTSFITESKETFMTKEHRYEYAPSASTRYVETHSEVETPSPYFANKTTLLLLACRTKKWELVESLLDNYTPNTSHKDEKGSNALHLAIEANNPYIAKKIIGKMDNNVLKSEVNSTGKTALKLITEMILNGSPHDEFNSLEKAILQKTGQKQNPYRTPKLSKSEMNVVKSKTQKLQLVRRISCGFTFQYLKPSVWVCAENNCGVGISVDEDITFKDLNHSKR